MRYLGIDYGKRKMGLAVSEGQLASIFKVIQTTSLKDSLEKISKVVDEEKIDRIVVGVPEGETSKLVKVFIEHLIKFLKYKPQIPEVIETDETLSSKDAKRLMIELGISRNKRRTEDAYSAALILQHFLDRLN